MTEEDLMMGYFKLLLHNIEKRKLTLCAIREERTTVFSDRFETTIKKLIEIADDDYDKMGLYSFETQDSQPVRFYKGFLDLLGKYRGKHQGDREFTKGGMTQGDIIKVTGQGYLSNREDGYKVILVTDDYVYIKNESTTEIDIKSHDEIKKMKSMNGIILDSNKEG